MASRIAIVDPNRCKPEKCRRECISNCPPQSGGKEVIKLVDVEDIAGGKEIRCKKKIASIVEQQCIGCNICVKKCPFNAIRIVNLPFEDKSEIVHRYSPNGFRLYRLPVLKKNTITGIVGENGIGKSTLINILSNQLTPNFENFKEVMTERQILSRYRGSVLYDYLKSLYSGHLKISIKPQRPHIDAATVREFLRYIDDTLLSRLELAHLLEANIKDLSGGELQRLLCYQTLSTEADVYIFDEPSNYLDIKQRLEITRLIREKVHPDRYVVVIDHDMSMVDFMADELVILYGKPSVYGIVSQPMTTLEGINVYMDGYIPSENVRFRPEEFHLKPSIELVNQDIVDDEKSFVPYGEHLVVYPLSKFSLHIPSDRVNLQGSIHVIMGENGNGKSTFLKYIAKTIDVPVSYKPQTLGIKKYSKDGVYPTVSELFYSNIHLSYTDQRFQNDVVRPLQIGDITDRRLDQLSGGELQRVLLILCLGTPASIYMIDEPSANLDIEKRMTVIKVIKRFILNYKKCAFVIEHDMMMAVAFSQEYTSRILTISKTVRDGQRECVASRYMNFNDGITSFLKMLDITMRISNHNRPRINKSDSQLDKEQKASGMFYV